MCQIGSKSVFKLYAAFDIHVLCRSQAHQQRLCQLRQPQLHWRAKQQKSVHTIVIPEINFWTCLLFPIWSYFHSTSPKNYIIIIYSWLFIMHSCIYRCGSCFQRFFREKHGHGKSASAAISSLWLISGWVLWIACELGCLRTAGNAWSLGALEVLFKGHCVWMLVIFHDIST